MDRGRSAAREAITAISIGFDSEYCHKEALYLGEGNVTS